MQKVFELDIKEPGGDTHSVIEIQQRVKEMLGLGARDKQREEISKEIQSHGPYALPGVLNATYVFTGRLKGKEQKLLAGLLAELVGENQAAREMLLKTGVLEAPFRPTRKTAVLALQQLGDIREEDIERIRLRAWRDADESGDYKAALILYEFLAQHRDDQACSEIRRLAQNLFKGHVDIGPRFLDLALRCAPQDSYQILKDVLGEMDRKATKFSSELKETMSIEFVANHLPQILQAANEVKRGTVGYAHKGIENLFIGPIALYLEGHPDVILETGELVHRRYKSLYRFWWQGLARRSLLKLETVKQYFKDQTTPPLDEFTLEGAVQLLFIERDSRGKLKRWALDLLKQLKENRPDQYESALYEFAERQGETVDDPGVDPVEGGSGLTKG